MRVGEGFEADIADAGVALADQDRRAVEQQPIDHIGGEKGGCGTGSAFDEEMVEGEVGDGVG